MFEKIVDLVAAGWERICPVEVVNVYQGAAILRFGRVHRILTAPGLYWKWPLAENVITAETCLTTHRLQPQTLTTKDDVCVTVGAIVKYRIDDIRPYVEKIWDQRDVLADSVLGAVYQAVGERTYEELVKENPARRVLELARREVKPFGFHIEKVTFTDIGRMRSIRLITHNPLELDN